MWKNIKKLADSGVDPKQLAPNNLTVELSASYKKLLQKNRHWYDGHRGCMMFDIYILTLSAEYKPVHAKLYPIPHGQDHAAKGHIKRLIKLKILKQIDDMDTASPAFFVSISKRFTPSSS